MSIKKRNLIRETLKRGRYTVVPNRLLSATDLSSSEKVIWCYLLSLAPKWTGGRNSLAKNLSISPKLVTSTLKVLEQKGLIKVIRNKTTFSFEFTEQVHWLIDPEFSSAEDEMAPDLGENLLHTKEERKIISTNSFSQEGSIYRNPLGAEGDLREAGNAHIPEKLDDSNITPSDFISPEAEAIYKGYVDNGRTPADFNGRSLVEIANERAYADQIPTLDTTELVRQWKQQSQELDLKAMLQAAGITDEDD